MYGGWRADVPPQAIGEHQARQHPPGVLCEERVVVEDHVRRDGSVNAAGGSGSSLECGDIVEGYLEPVITRAVCRSEPPPVRAQFDLVGVFDDGEILFQVDLALQVARVLAGLPVR